MSISACKQCLELQCLDKLRKIFAFFDRAEYIQGLLDRLADLEAHLGVLIVNLIVALLELHKAHNHLKHELLTIIKLLIVIHIHVDRQWLDQLA